MNFPANFILDIARNYPLLLVRLVSVFLLLLSVHVTIILTIVTVLTDRKFLSTVHIPGVTTSTNHVNDQSINHITTTVNHPTPTRNPTVSSHPVINAPDHSTPIRSRMRRRKRKTKTNRYWRRDNHNIQLDTNAVINLSSVTLSQDENQLLARGLSFCPTPRNINWTEVRADLHEFSRRTRLLEYFHDYPAQNQS